MPFDRSVFNEKLRNRDSDFFISEKEITKVIFNKDEIVFTLLKTQKIHIPDMISFTIAAMGATGSDERDMYNSDILLTDPKMMFQKITGFQNLWKLDLAIENYIDGEIQYVYEVFIDPEKRRYESEISFLIETGRSFIYFFTNHFYY
ncbi:hypothetical protein V2E39_19235 [Chryseobacterium arthrosphaerae]|uniref:Uncharacterized protein n=1 Tax=Chryseobacterium arthrosphaerae TaxID=651561 RepID=A0ABU7R411_9FLAO|nr:hypothetical protein [Chryseobacterium arthrosphaerae]